MHNHTYNFKRFMKNSKTYLMGFWLIIPKLKQWLALC